MNPTDDPRYQAHRDKDPYNCIPHSLLQSGHIWSYAKTVGMIDPFDPALLKSATYEVKLEGKCVIFNPDGRRIAFYLGVDPGRCPPGWAFKTEFALEKNSIAFLTLEPIFRLPYYIAARFNLKIKNVYRGLLLGTGPIVDPGFCGQISLPLHNLTDNRYYYRGGEKFAWFEFTKTTWREGARIRSPRDTRDALEEMIGAEPLEVHESFPAEKLNRLDILDYLEHANGSAPIQSSLPPVLTRVARQAQTTRRLLTTYSILGTIALAALVVGGHQVILSTISIVGDARSEITSITRDSAVLGTKLDEALKELNTLTEEKAAVATEMINLRKEISNIPKREEFPTKEFIEILERRIRQMETELSQKPR